MKKCENCTHYIQHFIKRKKDFFAIDFGHCSDEPDGCYRKVGNPCEAYSEKDFEKEKEEQIKTVTKFLLKISVQLEKLIAVLNSNLL